MSSKKVECLFVTRCILTKPHAETEKDLRINVSPLFSTLSSVARPGFEPGTSGL
jgi:hypothetical protein